MKELRNNVDYEARFDDLEKAKNWYNSNSNPLCSEDEYLGDDYELYCSQFEEYQEEIKESKTLEELATVLNKYTDIFEDGRQHEVVEF